MLDAITLDPADDAAWLALADCLEDEGRPREAEVARLRERLRHLERDDPTRPGDERRMQQLLAEGVTPIGPSLTMKLSRGKTMEFCLIPPGSFWMGSPEDEPGRADNEPLRLTRINRGFWLARGLTTLGQHRGGTDAHPAPLDWADLRDADLSQRWDRSVRLPGSAEWEYACRAGTTTACHGGDLVSLPLVGWCAYGEHARERQRTKPVAQYAPNAWGLYDMHGNLWEWTSDEPLAGSRVGKGGSYRTLPARCRSAAWTIWSVADHDTILGVRYLIDLD